jgi:hypothetical protein
MDHCLWSRVLCAVLNSSQSALLTKSDKYIPVWSTLYVYWKNFVLI